LVAAHHLHKRDGVVIGDVVGLGKTITATALAKLFEDDFFLETLNYLSKKLSGNVGRICSQIPIESKSNFTK
jgi:hypothetical protein